MVLTNFECWAHGGSGDGPLFVDTVIERRNPGTVDLFNPNALQEYSDHCASDSPKIVSHLSSNGYYGFAPICKAVVGYDAATIGSDDVKSNLQQQQQGDSVQMMDVEQHGGSNVPRHVQNSPQSADVAIGEDVKPFRNGSPGRRKRCFLDDDYYQIQRRNAKRCRFDQQREEYLSESNNGGYPSTYAPTAVFPLGMDQEELPVTFVKSPSDVHVAAPCDESVFMAGNSRLVVNSSGDDSSNSKRSYNKNIHQDFIIYNPYTPPLSPNPTHTSINTKTLFDPPLVANSNNNVPNTKENENKSAQQLKLKNSTANGNDFCYDQTYDDQLEKLFLLTHGGGDHNLWRHLTENSCADI